jgi:hypothetical protein
VKWCRLAAVVATLAASCGSEPQAPPADADPTPKACADTDIECRNRLWLAEFEEEEARQPKLPLDEIFGDWVVTAALEPEGRFAGTTWVETYAHRDVWIGAEVSVTREAIAIEPPAGAPVVSEYGLGAGALYPRCTKPDFDTDEMVSASPVEEWIELWQHFGFDKPAVGRPVIVHCTGGPEFPDDPSGHVAEMTIEEAHAIESLYLYDRDHLIIQWGEVELLLQRKPRSSNAPL